MARCGGDAPTDAETHRTMQLAWVHQGDASRHAPSNRHRTAQWSFGAQKQDPAHSYRLRGMAYRCHFDDTRDRASGLHHQLNAHQPELSGSALRACKCSPRAAYACARHD
eukprot:CAMPEP_0119392438 /NCGR_PEP_ID=MMETSP1334-20130426/121145_1 /TAXON_ID=127549 /ORGANISM="Calcidiscus leptoporus, Strain RCC1130" /LENGTH=109 /DNA_ID=CAMNT_0007415289 /DNA_START=15 /DNA_END=344 /DNA_ORIENTATION=+